MQHERPPHTPGYCPHPVMGFVTSNADPEKRGRIKVRIPVFADGEYPLWADARGACYAPRSGRTRAKGKVLRPAPETPVIITFLNGDMNLPLWEPGPFPRDGQPVEAAATPPKEVLLSTDKGNVVTENDRGDLELHAHNHRDLTVHSHDGHIKVESGGGTILLDSTLDGPNVAREGDSVDLGSLVIAWVGVSPMGPVATVAVTWQAPGTPPPPPLVFPAGATGSATIPLIGRVSSGTSKVRAGDPPLAP